MFGKNIRQLQAGHHRNLNKSTSTCSASLIVVLILLLVLVQVVALVVLLLSANFDEQRDGIQNVLPPRARHGGFINQDPGSVVVMVMLTVIVVGSSSR